MKNSTLLKTFCLGAVMALAATVPAQTTVRKAGSKALVPLRVVTPIRSHAGITKSGKAVAGISKLTPKRAESQQSEIINEDFSNFTSGSLSDPDTLNWVANTWKGTSNDIASSMTQQSGWIGNFVAQAGGAAGLRAPGAAYQASAFIATPAQDYSGSVTVTFRARRWPGYKGNININTYVSDDDGKGYGSEEGSTGIFRIFGSDDGWQYYTWTFDWHNSSPANRIWFNTYDWAIIDDVNVKVSADNFVAEPTVKEVTNVTDSSFTINWNTVRAANTYLIGLKKKVWTSDVDSVNYYYDFEDGQIPAELTTTGTVVDGVGASGSKALALADGDSVTFPINNATYKRAGFFMTVTGPENAVKDDLAESEIDVYVRDKDGQWTHSGYYIPGSFLNSPAMIDPLKGWYGSLADTYSAIRVVPAGFPEGYKLIIDSIAVTTNRPYDFEIINEPDNFYSYGENYDYTTHTGFIDWHVSSSITNPCTSYTVKDLDQIGITYDPSAEYYYSVIARRYTTNSTYTWHHAFCLPAPVATGAKDKDDRGSYTATWTGPVKATRYSVNNYGVYVAAADEENHAIIDEDFSLFDNTVTSATDPTAPASAGNDYQVVLFDGYTYLPGWTGLCNTVAQGYLGCSQATYYVPFVKTPDFQADNDENLTLHVKAVGAPNDDLTLQFANGDTYVAPFDANGNLDIEATVPEKAKTTSISIGSYNYAAFMLDEFAVKQNLKAGANVFTKIGNVVLDADKSIDTLSYTFNGLEGYDYYAYDVTALQDLDGDVAVSDVSTRPTFSLDANTPDPIIVDGIESVAATANGGFVKVVARYGVDGRQVSADTKGLQILKLSDGRIVKAIVR